MYRIILLFLTASAIVGAYAVYYISGNLMSALILGSEFLTALGVLAFAFVQVGLNRRLIGLQDYVAVSAVRGKKEENGVRFYNTGKINIYIHRIELRDVEADLLIGSTNVFKDPRLIPAGTLESSYYFYPFSGEMYKHKEFKFVLLLTDELGRKWLSSHGAEFLDKNTLRLWSHKTHQKNWVIYKGSDETHKN